MQSQKKYLTENQLAEMLQISVKSIQNKRQTGLFSIPYIKIGKLVRYDMEVVREYLKNSQRTSTSQTENL